jgi:hypothetical protein
MGKARNSNRPLTQEEIWDDSALVQSWDEAVEEYKVRFLYLSRDYSNTFNRCIIASMPKERTLKTFSEKQRLQRMPGRIRMYSSRMKPSTPWKMIPEKYQR